MINNQQPIKSEVLEVERSTTNNARPNERHQSFGRGFTLIELMTAISIFIVVMTISMGSIINVFDANRKARSLKTVLNNLNLAVESMSREMRFGKNYHCGSGTITVPRNCPSGGTLVSFLSSENTQITYRLNGQTIEKRVGSGSYIAVTAPEIVIDRLTFYTLGAGTSNTLQPKTIIIIKGHAGIAKSRSDFTLQTLVSQRFPDL
jgi:prepilin-type N-terminal cleavage/methylation domain-containing protein